MIEEVSLGPIEGPTLSTSQAYAAWEVSRTVFSSLAKRLHLESVGIIPHSRPPGVPAERLWLASDVEKLRDHPDVVLARLRRARALASRTHREEDVLP